ncbi:esterase/lipase/thioesterase [Candidatus Rickettsiella viridis]|uniref:Esterase/lipase/thioesterase n=1 Tax=Candidatus Rickettsiella viridis TaxID=676208 RepID=A0A2Z5V703_9COXI|nr:alpha/beta hydrolase [Candidatus Rickettsiella viridis]BBB14977.1 esterase/lipase/thioesterase [Candidatus Rickettsiella viridis]
MPLNYTISEHRKFILSLQQKEKRIAAKNVIISPLFFSLENNNRLTAFIYRPFRLASNKLYPTVLHIRGTGYNADARYYAYITCSHLAEKSSCQVIDLDHRLAPEYPCPIGFNDVYASIKSIIKNSEQLKIDPEKIAISGYSSGGNFAALAAIQAKTDKLPISLQLLISPITDLSRNLKKYSNFEKKDSFPLSLAQWFITLYLQQGASNPKSPLISPYWSNDLTNLPPTYFLCGEFDRFRSDSEGYRNKLAKAHVWTHMSVFKKENHSFFWHNIRVIETMATQLRMSFNLFSIPRSITQKRISEKQEKSPDLKKSNHI